MANLKLRSTRLGVLDIGSNTVHMLVVDAAVGARPEPEASSKTTVRLMDHLKDDGSIKKQAVDALLGVLDIGSNTVHMLVVDAAVGARPEPEASSKTTVRLMDHLKDDGSIKKQAVDALLAAVDDAMRLAEQYKVSQLLALATSAMHEAPNGNKILHRVEEVIGQRVTVLSGEDEARLTFLAARRWYGWDAGRLLMIDIGGGSLEVALGSDEEPTIAAAVNAGAGVVTRDLLPDGMASAKDLDAVYKKVRKHRRRLARSRAWLRRGAHHRRRRERRRRCRDARPASRRHGVGERPRRSIQESAQDDRAGRRRRARRGLFEPRRRHVEGDPFAEDYSSHAVGTSKAIRSLARLAGTVIHQPGREDALCVERGQLEDWIPRLAAIEPAQRAALPGITQDRAMTIVGAGILAVEIMRALGINEIEVCPWALREGAILRWLDQYGRTVCPWALREGAILRWLDQYGRTRFGF